MPTKQQRDKGWVPPSRFADKFEPNMSINLLTGEPRAHITHVSQMQPLRLIDPVEAGDGKTPRYRSGYWYNRMDGTE